MKYYYQDEWVTIYHGDCREILPQLPRVDLVLTDPPYGLGEAYGKNLSRGKWANPRDYGYSHWDDRVLPDDLIQLIIDKAPKSILWGGNYYRLPPSSCWLVWDKENGENDFADCELAWTNLDKAVRMYRFRWAGMLQGDMKNKEYRWHPTQKPVSLMRWCIAQAGDIQTILDPLMGSGSTIRASLDMNRKCMGIEIEEKYCEIAAKRCLQGVFNLG